MANNKERIIQKQPDSFSELGLRFANQNDNLPHLQNNIANKIYTLFENNQEPIVIKYPDYSITFSFNPDFYHKHKYKHNHKHRIHKTPFEITIAYPNETKKNICLTYVGKAFNKKTGDKLNLEEYQAIEKELDTLL